MLLNNLIRNTIDKEKTCEKSCEVITIRFFSFLLSFIGLVIYVGAIALMYGIRSMMDTNTNTSYTLIAYVIIF